MRQQTGGDAPRGDGATVAAEPGLLFHVHHAVRAHAARRHLEGAYLPFPFRYPDRSTALQRAICEPKTRERLVNMQRRTSRHCPRPGRARQVDTPKPGIKPVAESAQPSSPHRYPSGLASSRFERASLYRTNERQLPGCHRAWRVVKACADWSVDAVSARPSQESKRYIAPRAPPARPS